MPPPPPRPHHQRSSGVYPVGAARGLEDDAEEYGVRAGIRGGGIWRSNTTAGVGVPSLEKLQGRVRLLLVVHHRDRLEYARDRLPGGWIQEAVQGQVLRLVASHKEMGDIGMQVYDIPRPVQSISARYYFAFVLTPLCIAKSLNHTRPTTVTANPWAI